MKAAGTARAEGTAPPWWDEAPGHPVGLPWVPGPPLPPARRRLRPAGAVVLVAAVALVVGLLVAVAVRAHGGVTAQIVTTPFLSYPAPPGWSAPPADRPTLTEAPALTGVVHGPGYTCGGEPFVRGFAAAALLPTGPAAAPADVAERLARWFATTSYPAPAGTPPEVTVAPPRPVRVTGPGGPVDGTVVEATARAPGGRATCAGSAGRVLALAVPVSGGAAVLLAAADTDGGPAEPVVPDRSTLDTVLTGVQLRTA